MRAGGVLIAALASIRYSMGLVHRVILNWNDAKVLRQLIQGPSAGGMAVIILLG